MADAPLRSAKGGPCQATSLLARWGRNAFTSRPGTNEGQRATLRLRADSRRAGRRASCEHGATTVAPSRNIVRQPITTDPLVWTCFDDHRNWIGVWPCRSRRSSSPIGSAERRSASRDAPCQRRHSAIGPLFAPRPTRKRPSSRPLVDRFLGAAHMRGIPGIGRAF
jgi:hypothetical protein